MQPRPIIVTLVDDVWTAQFQGLTGPLAPMGVAPTVNEAINMLVNNFEVYYAK